MNSEPFHRGAEADLYAAHAGPWKVVIKKRNPKQYREPVLDASIRRERTTAESSLIHESRLAGVRVPSLIAVDLDNTSIVMTFVDGVLVRDGLDAMSPIGRKRFFIELGRQVGLLHSGGIVHGDLTTSNIISSHDIPFLLDFGMAHHSSQPEDRAVDLHLLQRSISTSHTSKPSACISSLVNGYRKTLGDRAARIVWRKATEISRRGRYFSVR
ncbi:MAG TPA: Kae1-associated kinase Bud32 [Candidatus Bathyarchaeia archaeon]|nr:Kae1-associated kinase Bud32 [Candidatus Bathyarchaeia archaeon]